MIFRKSLLFAAVFVMASQVQAQTPSDTEVLKVAIDKLNSISTQELFIKDRENLEASIKDLSDLLKRIENFAPPARATANSRIRVTVLESSYGRLKGRGLCGPDVTFSVASNPWNGSMIQFQVPEKSTEACVQYLTLHSIMEMFSDALRAGTKVEDLNLSLRLDQHHLYVSYGPSVGTKSHNVGLDQLSIRDLMRSGRRTITIVDPASDAYSRVQLEWLSQ